MTLLAWLLMYGWLSFPVGILDDFPGPPKPRVQVQDDYPMPPKPRVQLQNDIPSPPKP